MKLLIVAAPMLVLAAYVVGRAAAGRPLGRHALNVLVALVLLAYVIVTAGLGLFWVARMDLPAFDWHYLFGYCLLALLAAHVALQLHSVEVFFRRISPSWLTDADGTRFRRSARVAFALVAGAALTAPLGAWIWGRWRAPPAAVVRSGGLAPPVVGSSTGPRVVAEEIWIERAGERLTAVEYLYQRSVHTRTELFTDPAVARARPPETKTYPGPGLRLPSAATRAGITLDQALAPVAEPRAAQPDAGDRIVVGQPRGEPRLGQEALSTVLHQAAGVTSRKAETAGLLLRAAASAGALYPIDLYVVSLAAPVADRRVRYYDPLGHALFESGDAGSVARLVESLPRDSSARAASELFVLGATFDRTVFKYRSRSYRYIALDAGHLAENLVLASAALGQRCTLEPRFDDDALLAALGGDPRREAALLVVGCAARDGDPHPARRIPAHRPVELPERVEHAELTRLTHRMTSWKLLSEQNWETPTLAPSARSPELIALPAAPAATTELFEAIAARRSFRELAAAPIPLDELAGVLADASRALGSLGGPSLVTLDVIATRVAGLEPGAHRYLADRHALAPLARGDFASRIERAGLDQEVLGRAAAVLVWSFDRERVGRVDGARDFRHALIEAGLGGEAAYLSATARGLGICGVGAFYDAEVAALLGDARAQPVYSMAIGRRS